MKRDYDFQSIISSAQSMLKEGFCFVNEDQNVKGEQPVFEKGGGEDVRM